MSNSCAKVKDKLMQCISTTECAERGGSAAECVKDPALPESCIVLRKMFFECKRGQLDMRNRIRGNKHADPSNV
ncbi:cytochrome c oxidase assembly protein PET191 [Baffinella frigidus]|nr:cytochrome c oxidase assembly protein PET191 [Cryptophyta sp. CCMP2293]